MIAPNPTAEVRRFLAENEEVDPADAEQMLLALAHAQVSLLCDAVDALRSIRERMSLDAACGFRSMSEHAHTWQRYPDHMQSQYGPTHVCTVCGEQRTALPGEVP